MNQPAAERLLVVIPAYNEAINIRRVAAAVAAQGCDVVVVDDGSTDATKTEAEAGGAAVIAFPANRGKGAALREGFAYAARKEYPLIAVMDGDGQHDPAEIKGLAAFLAESKADMVIGTRMNDVRTMPFVRKMTNIIMSRFISWLARTRLTDTQSGFRVMKTSMMSAIDLRTNRFDTESEIIIRAGRKGFVIRELPIRTIYGVQEKSSIRPVVDTFRFVGLVLRCLFT